MSGKSVGQDAILAYEAKDQAVKRSGYGFGECEGN